MIHWVGYIIFQKYSCCCCSVHSCWLPDDSCPVGRGSWRSLANNNYQAVTRDLMIDLAFPLMSTYCKWCEKKRAEIVVQVTGLLGVMMDSESIMSPLMEFIFESLKQVKKEFLTWILHFNCVALVEMWYMLFYVFYSTQKVSLCNLAWFTDEKNPNFYFQLTSGCLLKIPRRYREEILSSALRIGESCSLYTRGHSPLSIW